MRTAWIIVALLFSSSILLAGVKVDERLARTLAAGGDNEKILVWVYFNDKGPAELSKNLTPEQIQKLALLLGKK